MLSSSRLEAILQFDTCTIANAIEHFKVRLRNEGFTRPGLRCVTKGATHLLGYTRSVDFGQPAEIFGLQVRAGDLLYADCHGVVSIPLDIAPELPEVPARIRSKEQRIVQVCLSPGFSTEKLFARNPE